MFSMVKIMFLNFCILNSCWYKKTFRFQLRYKVQQSKFFKVLYSTALYFQFHCSLIIIEFLECDFLTWFLLSHFINWQILAIKIRKEHYHSSGLEDSFSQINMDDWFSMLLPIMLLKSVFSDPLQYSADTELCYDNDSGTCQCYSGTYCQAPA